MLTALAHRLCNNASLRVRESSDATAGSLDRLAAKVRYTEVWRKGINVPTSKKVASKASKVLKSPKATKAQKSVAASDLAQTKRKPRKKK